MFRSLRPSRGWPAFGLAAVALLLAGLATAQVQVRNAATETFQTANLIVFTDTFDGSGSYATYQPLGGAVVTESGGRLTVSVPDGSTNAGLSMRIPPGGTGVKCTSFGGLQIQEAPIGTYMRWTWWGYDDLTGKEVFLLETEITKTNSFTVRHRKADGTTVSHHVPGKNWDDVKKKWWDTRRSGKQVMLEIKFKDGTKYKSGWIDPPASTMAGVDITSSVPEFSIDTAEGAEVHLNDDEVEPTDAEPTEPQTLPNFDSPALTNRFPHWIHRLWDSDHVVRARVESLGAAVEIPDAGLRLPVTYTVLDAFHGNLGGERIVAYHQVQGPHPRAAFRKGAELLLILEREPFDAPDGRLLDSGSPAGVIPYSAKNQRALTARLDILNLGLEANYENP